MNNHVNLLASQIDEMLPDAKKRSIKRGYSFDVIGGDPKKIVKIEERKNKCFIKLYSRKHVRRIYPSGPIKVTGNRKREDYNLPYGEDTAEILPFIKDAYNLSLKKSI